MGMGIGTIMKMVAFILIAVAFALSFFMFKKSTVAFPLSSYLVAAVLGGFFAVYLAGFIASFGSPIDSDLSRTWAIYACCALFGTGFRMMYVPVSVGCGDDLSCTMTVISGICAIAASVFCFLDALFGK